MQGNDSSSLIIPNLSAEEDTIAAITTDEQLFKTYAKTEENFSLIQAVKEKLKNVRKCSSKFVNI